MNLANLSPQAQPRNIAYENSQKLSQGTNWATYGLNKRQIENQEKQQKLSNALSLVNAGINIAKTYAQLKDNEVSRKSAELDLQSKGLDLQAKNIALQQQQQYAEEDKKFLDDVGSLQSAGEWQRLGSYLMSNPTVAQRNASTTQALINQIGYNLNLSEEDVTGMLSNVLPEQGRKQYEFGANLQKDYLRAQMSSKNKAGQQDLVQQRKLWDKQQTNINKFNAVIDANADNISALSNIVPANADGNIDYSDIFDKNKFAIQEIPLKKLQEFFDALPTQGTYGEPTTGNNYLFTNENGRAVDPTSGELYSPEDEAMIRAFTPGIEEEYGTNNTKVKDPTIHSAAQVVNLKTGELAVVTFDKKEFEAFAAARRAKNERKALQQYAYEQAGIHVVEDTPNEYQTSNITPTQSDSESESENSSSNQGVFSIPTSKVDIEDNKLTIQQRVAQEYRDNPDLKFRHGCVIIATALAEKGVERERAASEAMKLMMNAKPQVINYLLTAVTNARTNGEDTASPEEVFRILQLSDQDLKNILNTKVVNVNM